MLQSVYANCICVRKPITGMLHNTMHCLDAEQFSDLCRYKVASEICNVRGCSTVSTWGCTRQWFVYKRDVVAKQNCTLGASEYLIKIWCAINILWKAICRLQTFAQWLTQQHGSAIFRVSRNEGAWQRNSLDGVRDILLYCPESYYIIIIKYKILCYNSSQAEDSI
jgi:hypothetical protein